MKKKKGFTLIELLAIIVILAIIAVVVTPIILDIIEDSKISAATDSAYGYKDSIQKYYTTMLSQNNDFMLDGEYTIGNNGSISDTENTYDILASGTIPNSGYVNIEKGLVVSGCIQINEYAVTLEDKKVTNTVKGNCTDTPKEPDEIVVEEFPQVNDTNPGIICGDNNTEDYDNNNTCYIYSVEDLVAFSNMVNSGKNFEGKTIQLMNNLDIENDNSYANVNSNAFGDINENNTTSETLKEELTDTTGKEFKPIGNDSNKFSGTFEGNAKTIKDLYINRSSTDYIGLFGYNAGTIKGLKMASADIIGYRYVGGIVGSNRGNLTSTVFDGNVTGYYTTGLASGENTGTVESITNGNVETTTKPYESSVGGIVGSSSGNVKGLFKSGSVTAGNSSGVARTVGRGSSTATGALNTILINGNTVTNATISSGNGYDIPANYINNIAIADNILDTYLGGDNNNDGYYYDYDNTGNFTVYSLADHPLNITMSGQGTELDPYIINNYNDLKQVGYILGTDGSGLHYRLNADIDLTNQNSIMLGRSTDTNANTHTNTFTGTFDGNGHKINNIKLLGYDYVGLFGYNQGAIKGLKVTNLDVTGYRYVGGIAGSNAGNITSIIINGNVTGYYTTGLAVGENLGTVEGITSGNVVTTTISYESSIGGITGRNGSSATTKGIYISGSVTSETSSSVGRTIGSTAGINSTGALDTIIINGNTSSSTNKTSKDGKSYTASELQTLAPYQEVGLNTSPTTGEYRYALDSNYNPYIIKN